MIRFFDRASETQGCFQGMLSRTEPDWATLPFVPRLGQQLHAPTSVLGLRFRQIKHTALPDTSGLQVQSCDERWIGETPVMRHTPGGAVSCVRKRLQCGSIQALTVVGEVGVVWEEG